MYVALRFQINLPVYEVVKAVGKHQRTTQVVGRQILDVLHPTDCAL